MRIASLSTLVILAVPIISSAQQPNEDSQSPVVEVLLYNYAAVPEKTLHRATEHAARILDIAGVKLDWIACPTVGRVDGTPCEGLSRPNQVAVRLLLRQPSEEACLDPGTGGVAARLGEGGSGYVTIYHERIAQIARRVRVSIAQVLGPTLAHEIGHLLLPPGHSRRGIMREPLSAEEWLAAAMGRLLFTGEQAREMREGVLARMEQEKTDLAARSRR